jgi:hypothetical protein
MKRHITLTVLLSFLLSGCAVNRHLNFTGKVAGPGYLTGKPAVIVVQDKRTAVLSGKEKTSWCGHNYSMAQIAYNIQTKSGRALADEFAELIARSYSLQGASAIPQYVQPEQATDSLIRTFRENARPLLFLFDIREWETGATPGFSTIRYEHLYDLKLTVFDDTGESRATTDVHGKVSLKEGAVTSIARMQEIADEVLRVQVEALFNAPAVRALAEKK